MAGVGTAIHDAISPDADAVHGSDAEASAAERITS
jgi:hypothetical protein